MSQGATRALWTGGIILGAAAIGGIVYAVSRPAPEQKIAVGGGGNAGGGSGTTIPAGALITDPALVKSAQGMLATILLAGLVFGADYDQARIDGNPSNPKFIAALKAFQMWLNATGAKSTGYVLVSKLNEQGVLDSSTSAALAYVSSRSLMAPIVNVAV